MILIVISVLLGICISCFIELFSSRKKNPYYSYVRKDYAKYASLFLKEMKGKNKEYKINELSKISSRKRELELNSKDMSQATITIINKGCAYHYNYSISDLALCELCNDLIVNHIELLEMKEKLLIQLLNDNGDNMYTKIN